VLMQFWDIVVEEGVDWVERIRGSVDYLLRQGRFKNGNYKMRVRK